MERAHSTTEPQGSNFVWVASEVSLNPLPKPQTLQPTRFTPLKPVRQWLDTMPVQDPKLARTVASMIPAQCPFERTVKLFGRTILYIPPLCKLNPLYEELVGLRFRALCYLADECGEDISSYC
jgi:hypothetical protein